MPEPAGWNRHISYPGAKKTLLHVRQDAMALEEMISNKKVLAGLRRVYIVLAADGCLCLPLFRGLLRLNSIGLTVRAADKQSLYCGD